MLALVSYKYMSVTYLVRGHKPYQRQSAAAAEDRKQQRFAQRPRRIFHMGGGGGDVYSSDRSVCWHRNTWLYI
jgi:hypothetical protein